MANTSTNVSHEGVFQSKLHTQAHEDKMYHELTQPTEHLILQRNAELRKNQGALKDLTFGRKLADIPLIMVEKAKKQGYDLLKNEQDLMRWLQTEDGKLCLVQEQSTKYFGGI